MKAPRGWGKKIDEAFGGRLRLVVGQAGALVGFDDHVVGLVGGLDQEVQAHHRYFQGPRGLDRGLAEGRMEGVGDVLEDAAGVQVGGAPHGQVFAAGQHVVVAIAGGPQGALGLVVERDAAFPPVAAWRRRLCASISSRMLCRPSPITAAGRRMAAATTS